MSPTLSILIPVYKRDCRRLLEELYKQAEELSVGYEIILGDDCSGEPYTSQYIAYEQGDCADLSVPKRTWEPAVCAIA